MPGALVGVRVGVRAWWGWTFAWAGALALARGRVCRRGRVGVQACRLADGAQPGVSASAWSARVGDREGESVGKRAEAGMWAQACGRRMGGCAGERAGPKPLRALPPLNDP